jgi:hypothetical protein
MNYTNVNALFGVSAGMVQYSNERIVWARPENGATFFSKSIQNQATHAQAKASAR